MKIFLSVNNVLKKYAVFDSKKSIFIKNQEASGLISNLELKIALRNVFLLDGILF